MEELKRHEWFGLRAGLDELVRKCFLPPSFSFSHACVLSLSLSLSLALAPAPARSRSRSFSFSLFEDTVMPNSEMPNCEWKETLW